MPVIMEGITNVTRLGVIEDGDPADLILVDGNPLENLDLVADQIRVLSSS